MLAICAAIHLLVQVASDNHAASAPDPEQKAVAFLCREVPRWSRQKHCFSCHNNGDAARALLRAAEAGLEVPEDALADTTLWLQKPDAWEHNGGDGPFVDKRLARLAFTAALATAVSTGRVKDPRTLSKAAELLARDQADDGSWPLEGEDASSAPATYGRPLATLLARDSLIVADPARFGAAIDRAETWLNGRNLQNLTDASVTLMTISGTKQRPAPEKRRRAIELLAHAQAKDGGWGPDAFSPPEPFDTALALLALSKCEPTEHVKTMITAGRKFLIAEQLDDGSWTETTRPPGNVSYAEHMSTAGWATLALLATRVR